MFQPSLADLLRADKTVCISMRSEQDRWEDLQYDFMAKGVGQVDILEAIDGRSLAENADVPVGVWQRYLLKNNLTRTNHEQFGNWGAVGCYLSHIEAWKLALLSGVDRIMVLEDDVHFCDRLLDKFEVCLPELPDDFDVLILDPLRYETIEPRKKTFVKIKKFWGTHAYVISARVLPKLLNMAFPVEVHIDHFIGMAADILNLKLFVLDANICEQTQHSSSIASDCLYCDPPRYTLVAWIVCLSTVFVMFIAARVSNNFSLRMAAP